MRTRISSRNSAGSSILDRMEATASLVTLSSSCDDPNKSRPVSFAETVDGMRGKSSKPTRDQASAAVATTSTQAVIQIARGNRARCVSILSCEAIKV